MKNIIALLAILAIFSCKEEKIKNKEIAKIEEKEVHQEMYASWVGDFIAEEYDEEKEFVHVNKLNIVFKRITPNLVIGQSIVAGNSRLLTGTFNQEGNIIRFSLKEPGNQKYDGEFKFEFIDNNLVGSWEAYDKTLAVTKRSFKLRKKEFVYDPNLMLPEEGDYVDWENPKTSETKIDKTEGDGQILDSIDKDIEYTEEFFRFASDQVIKLNASIEKMDEETLKNLKKLDLEIIRNTIFARHGYTFKKKSIRQFFDPVEWYIPISENVDNDLTTIEKENIALLKRYEKYAEDNYDTFGR